MINEEKKLIQIKMRLYIDRLDSNINFFKNKNQEDLKMLGNRANLNRQKVKNDNLQRTENKAIFNNQNINTQTEAYFQQNEIQKNLPLQMSKKENQIKEQEPFLKTIDSDEIVEAHLYQEMKKYKTSNQIDDMSIDELDALVDLRISQFTAAVVQSCIHTKIHEELSSLGEILQSSSINLEKFTLNAPHLFSSSNQSCKEASSSITVQKSISSNGLAQDLINDDTQCFRYQNYPSLAYLHHSNTKVSSLLQHIQTLSSQKNQMQSINLNQQFIIKKRQRQFQELKQKYLQLMSDFDQYKKQSYEMQIKMDLLLQEKIEQGQSYKEQIKKLQLQVQISENKLKIMQENYQSEIDQLKQTFSQYYQLQTVSFIQHLNLMITQFQLPRSITSMGDSNNYKESQTTEDEANNLHSNFKSYQLKHSSIESQLDLSSSQSSEQALAALNYQSSLIQSLKALFNGAKETLIQTNSLQEYEIKVHKKDINKSPKTQLQQSQESQNHENQLIIDQVFSTIKNQVISLVKANRITSKQLQSRQLKIQQQDSKINNLMQMIDEKMKQNSKASRIPSSLVKIQNSPISMLQKQNESQVNDHNESSDQVQEFQAQEIVNSSFISVKQSEKENIESLSGNFKLIEQILSLKEENSRLKQQIQQIKIDSQNHITTQQLEGRSIKQEGRSQRVKKQDRMGKIKRLSANQVPQKPQNHEIKQKENMYKEANKGVGVIRQGEKGLSSKQGQEKIRTLETKVSQYKENIINLNEIINYMINQLRGYEFGRLFNDKENKMSSKQSSRIQETHQIEFSLRNLKLMGQNLPVRKHSHLQTQLLPVITENQNSYQCQDQSYSNQTTVNRSLTKTIKQVGKIACLNTSSSQVPTAKSSFVQNQEKAKASSLISKPILKQKYENFEFIRKLCLKEKNCKELLSKFHSYLEFYIQHIQYTHQSMQNNKIDHQFTQTEYSYPCLKTHLQQSEDYNEMVYDESFESGYNQPRRFGNRRNTQTYTIR